MSKSWGAFGHLLPICQGGIGCLIWGVACILVDVGFAQNAPSSQTTDSETTDLKTADSRTIVSKSRDIEEPVHSDVRPSSFQEIIPGKTTREELVTAVGEPKETVTEGDESILTYSLGPFPKVEMILTADVVDSIVVHMQSPSPPDAIAKELGLSGFAATAIFGGGGERLGQVYPERGVAFSFEPESNPPLVSQLVLEPISAEFFLLRAKDDSITNYEQKIADLNYVLKVNPKNSVAKWLKSRVYAKARYDARALTCIEQALSSEKSNPQYRLLRAELRFRLLQHTSALHEVRFILAQKNSDLVRGRASALLGDLLANGPKHDYQRAMDSHLAAIKLVAPLVASEIASERREAREILVKAHLAVANDVTHGEWSGKNESAPEWLKVAKELTDQYVSEDNGDEATRLTLLQKALSCYVGMRGVVDPTDVAHESQELGRQLLSQATDELRKREIQWLMIGSLIETVQIEQMRGQPDKVVQYTTQAEELLKQLETTEESTRRTHDALGRLFFLTGTTFAVHADDHQRAVHWYEKALPHLAKVRPPAGSLELVRHGQRFISIGVSYWELDGKIEAIRLTESGLRIMSTAVDAGKLDPAPLAVPYGNLAAMYRTVGREADAKRLAARAAKLEASGAETVIR